MPRRLTGAASNRVFAPLRLLALTLLLGGCALLRPDNATPLPGGGYWRPLAPDRLGQSLSAVQRVTGQFGEHRALLVFYLEVSGDHLALVGTTPDGTELFSLEQNGAAMNVKASPLLPPQMRPQAVLADLQLAFWPAAAVSAGLAGSGLELVEQPLPEGGARRLFKRDGEIVVAIDYRAADPWRGAVEFEQRAWHYRYTVETLNLDTATAP